MDSCCHAHIGKRNTSRLIPFFLMLLVSNYCLAAEESLSMLSPEKFSSDDSVFTQAYIDQDEWRNKPVRHRYVHGGFTGTETKFSFYFPPSEQYQGRFYQYITPVPDSEYLSQGAVGEEDKIGFSIESGAYFVESNGGGKGATATPGSQIDASIGAYRANAAVATFSRYLAQQIYSGNRPFGYIFGGSGGAYRTLGGIENTDGVWDGAVPFVMGSPMALPNVFTVRAYAVRVLADKLPAIADAVDAGSTKDLYSGLNAEQQAALKEVTRLGFPLRGWHAHKTMGLHAFAIIYPAVVAADPDYFKRFWSEPGYEGYKPTASLQQARVQHRSTIKKLIMSDEAESLGLAISSFAGQGRADDAWKSMQGSTNKRYPVAIQLSSFPEKNVLGADLLITSGAAADSKLPMTRLQGELILLGPENVTVLGKLQKGDAVRIDNSNYLAVQTYHRHQVPDLSYGVWDQFRDSKTKPLYPQRPFLLGPAFTQAASGSIQTGKFKGKMIVLENLYDIEAFPWQADWYRHKVKDHLGKTHNKNFRLWYTDHANHADVSRQTDPLHTVSYLGVLQQALRDLSDWVEKGVAPPETTRYQIEEGQVLLPARAADRKGIQPVVTAKANGKKRAVVGVGETVTLTGIVQVPPGAGKLVLAQWDFDGKGNFPLTMDLSNAKREGDQLTLSTRYQFKRVGTYFPVLRVASQRDGNRETPFARIQNLDRARVVVE